MGVKITFTDKSGKAGSCVFPTHDMADMYVRSTGVRNVAFHLTDTYKAVEVVKLGSKSHEEYKRRKAAMLEEDTSEQEAEAYMEAGVEAILLGATSSEALAAAAWASSNVRASEMEVENVCACGRSCGKHVTSCYICRKYA